jgi:hypothetical protein
MSSQKKGQPGVHEGPLVQMLDRQRVQQATADAKNLVDASVIVARKLVDAIGGTATAIAAAAATQC